MKPDEPHHDFDPIDVQILALLQSYCKQPLAQIGKQVGLSAPAVIERIKKLEDCGAITGYIATLDARKLGCDVTAFIGVSTTPPTAIHEFERQIDSRPEVLECHHVTGGYTLLLKIKTTNTATLEELISHIRSVDGVARTETMVVLSTHTEQPQLLLKPAEMTPSKRNRRNGEKLILHGKTAS